MYPNKAYCDRCAYSTEMHEEYAENTMLSLSHSSDDGRNDREILGQSFLMTEMAQFQGLK